MVTLILRVDLPIGVSAVLSNISKSSVLIPLIKGKAGYMYIHLWVNFHRNH